MDRSRGHAPHDRRQRRRRRRHAWTAARAGPHRVFRSASATTWRRTTRSPIACPARCRTWARPRAPATAFPPTASTTATGTTWAAGKPATPPPTLPTRTSSTPANISGSSRATTIGRGRPAPWAPGPTTSPAMAGRTAAIGSSGRRPIVVSPHDPKVVYHGANVLFRTRDGGQSWTAISPDLTTNDKTKQKWSGGPITGDNTGVEHYCTIFAVAESPLAKGLIWVGSDDGLVHVTRDGGGHLDERDREHPRHSRLRHGQPDRGLALRRRHRLRGRGRAPPRRHAARTSSRRRTTARRGRASPPVCAPDVYLHAVREDPKKKGMLYLGTERGVAVSRDDGATWEPLKLNLPTVAVHDLVVKGDDLVLGTHGRSIWILDDLTAHPRDLERSEVEGASPVPLSGDDGLALPRLLPRGRAGREPSGRPGACSTGSRRSPRAT